MIHLFFIFLLKPQQNQKIAVQTRKNKQVTFYIDRQSHF